MDTTIINLFLCKEKPQEIGKWPPTLKAQHHSLSSINCWSGMFIVVNSCHGQLIVLTQSQLNANPALDQGNRIDIISNILYFLLTYSTNWRALNHCGNTLTYLASSLISLKGFIWSTLNFLIFQCRQAPRYLKIHEHLTTMRIIS